MTGDERDAAALRDRAQQLEHDAHELRRQASRLDPPCGEWLDGHSYRKCDTPRSQCKIHWPALREGNTND